MSFKSNDNYALSLPDNALPKKVCQKCFDRRKGEHLQYLQTRHYKISQLQVWPVSTEGFKVSACIL